MYSRVLFATDLSEASDLALDCVAGWKGLGLPKATVAHVHAIHYVGGATGLEEQLRSDHAVLGLLATIEEWQPRLVVVGRYGRGREGRRLIGSTSHDVARESPAPVLVVPKG